jgi:hypothetical protein
MFHRAVGDAQLGEQGVGGGGRVGAHADRSGKGSCGTFFARLAAESQALPASRHMATKCLLPFRRLLF